MKDTLKNIPVLGTLGTETARSLKRFGRKLRGKNPRGWDKYKFQRIPLSAALQDGMDRPTQQIVNLLNYSKSSDKGQGDAYSNVSIKDLHQAYINGEDVVEEGRAPSKRLEHVPFDFKGKTVLDIGCNQGHMLFFLADRIKYGIGLDYDPPVVNAANKIRAHRKAHHLDFYIFDLENDPLELMEDMIPEEKIDIVFLLAVCAWIKNGAEVIARISRVSDNLLFEAHGTEEQQKEQIETLHKHYKNVKLLHQTKREKNGVEYFQRQMFLCSP